jgi:YesN/AraC family two-component response regulator
MGSRHYTVVVVEDEPLIMRNIVKKIRQMDIGFEVTGTARNGRDALAVIRNEPPDVVMTDIRMPLVDGLELLQQLYATDPAVRSVIISGYDDFEYARKAIQYNVRDYLLKPVESDMLYQCLLRLKIELDAEHASVVERVKTLKAAQGESIEEAVEKFRLFLEKNYRDDLNLGAIAQDLNFNPSYLSRCFVKLVGESPTSYIIHLRVSHARHLLKSAPELSVKEVGELVGYPDQNYFSRIFKLKTGISPAHYREKCLPDRKINTEV